ncbi:hypothetical protein RND81_12G093800 [Saponaria officinalis]|uniref:Uncharacterized protein n=1 Tax=Saponaria officinalis TaxID=3572 RepID=A0AAW1H8F1_SAPOF
MASMKVQKATSSDKNLFQPQYGVELTMNNQTLSDLTLDRCYTWSGTPTNPGFPGSIPAEGSATFTYLRGVDDGSIAAVVYTGTNENGTYAYVLGWDAPTDNTPTPNRVQNYSKDFDIISYLLAFKNLYNVSYFYRFTLIVPLNLSLIVIARF